ncbi:hypothetical protein [Flavobacterium aquicola]|uniref:Uncharacterized protein n=1 Tax=Flavobacterium aquicola TaxID=1682742 RepID=A0A3E0DWX2_9FLAO|nr:hypothetical protein [Flavobacterium aquicola]REG90455.1 hypothetical protein C8P67_1247 [Flavobacterium aquicola]
MINNVALDVFIGLTFVFLLYSLLASVIQEMIAVRFSFRAKLLEKAILRMLEDGKTTTRSSFFDRIYGMLHLFGLVSILKDKKVAVWFYSHSLIKYLAEDNYYSKPAYLTAANFSKVMIDLLKGFNQPESQTIETIHNSIINGTIYKLPISMASAKEDRSNPAFKILVKENSIEETGIITASQTVQINPSTAFFLRSLWQESGADIDLFKSKLEQWFNDTMERTTDWYKRYTRFLLFIIGFAMACSFNVDAIAIHRILSKDKNAREQLVALAIKNNEKYVAAVQDIKNGTPQDDLNLQKTYDMVVADAKEATSTMGLGKPWEDSCTICKEHFKIDKNISFDDRVSLDDKIAVAKTSIIILQKKIDKIQNAQLEISSCNIQLKTKDSLLFSGTYRDTTQLKKDTARLNKMKTKVYGILKINHSDSLKIFKGSLYKMKILCERCPIIQKRNLFQYSANQRGDMETFLGWLLTAFAVTLGAPFWFDILSKLISVRGVGSKANSSSGTDPSSPVGKPNSTGSNPTNGSSTTIQNNSGEEAVG